MKNEVLKKFIVTALPVLERLEDAGHEAYLVGGCVRDALRSECLQPEEGSGEDPPRDITDIDVATSARPEQVKSIFSDMQVIDTGIAHGTVTILIQDGRIPIEITTFRSDGDYTDGRHPDEVSFLTSVEEDLSRRDLTINAMAADARGEITDPFGGLDDLAAGLIRAVGDPMKRFSEDGLRILRTLRFASVLGFEIERKTAEALLVKKDLLRGIAPERIFAELRKLFRGSDAGKVIRRFSDVFAVIIPEIAGMKGMDQKNPYHRYDVLEHCIRTMENVETVPENTDYMKLAALLHDVGKPETMTVDEEGIGHFYGHAEAGEKICRRIMSDFRSDRFTTDRVCKLVRYHDLVFEEDERLLKRWMNRYGADVLLDILTLKKADNIATGNARVELIEKLDRIGERIRRLVAEESCYRSRDLAVNGRDIIDAGIAEGPLIGEILAYLLEQVVEGRVPNEKEALIAAVADFTVSARP